MRDKRTATTQNFSRTQCGAALLIMLIILIIGIAVVLVSSLTASSVNSARQTTTAAALAQAKDALIGYAVTYADTHSGQVPGYLPCPDSDGSNGEGSSSISACGSKDVSQIGRLPWRTLGLSTLRDGEGECLWYAVSGTYKDINKTDMMNWDTNGQFTVKNLTNGMFIDSSQIVAIIFSPGAPLAEQGQNRSPDGTAPICGGNYATANYLDNDTVHGINNAIVSAGTFVQSHVDLDINNNVVLTVNDQMMVITRQDIWNAIQKRTDFKSTDPTINPLRKLTKQVANCISAFGHYNYGYFPHYPIGGSWNGGGSSSKALPWPAPLVLSNYSDNAQYNDSTNLPYYGGPPLYAGRVPYDVDISKVTTNNTLVGHLMTSTGSCASVSYAGAKPWTDSTLDNWWNNWKDQLFYALANDYRPRDTNSQDCLYSACLTINGSGQYAAVVLLAGPRLSALTQTRSDKSVAADYLEQANGTNMTSANGDENYKTGTSTSTFNDTMCYISIGLGVTCP